MEPRPNFCKVILPFSNAQKELGLLKDLPKGTCPGMVSVSTGILRAAAVISYSLRGDEILLMAVQIDDSYKLNAVIHSARTIVVFDEASLPAVKESIAEAREEPLPAKI